MKYTTKLIQVLLCLLLVAGSSNAESSKILLSGSSTLAPLAGEIAKRHEEAKPNLRIDVQTGGSSRGISDVIKGLSDIGMSSRALHEEEKKLVESHTVAIDGVAFVVHQDNPVENLTKTQLTKIYSGQITSWKELGGTDNQITVIDRANGRSEKELVKDYLELKPSEFQVDVVAGENQQCVKLIEGNPNAIVYLSVGTADYESRRKTKLKALSLEGISATPANVRNRSFPIIRPLIFVTKKNLATPAKEFIDFAQSKAVNDLISGQAFVPVQ